MVPDLNARVAHGGSTRGLSRRPSASSVENRSIPRHSLPSPTSLDSRPRTQRSHPYSSPILPRRCRRAHTAPGYMETKPVNIDSMGFTWFPWRDIVSEPTTPKRQKYRQDLAGYLPLKPCMKKTSKGATNPGATTSPHVLPLRRVKTVEFLPHHKVKPPSCMPLHVLTGDKQVSRGSRPSCHRSHSHPGSKIKSSAAGPVTTCTHVHVVTVSQSHGNDAMLAVDEDVIPHQVVLRPFCLDSFTESVAYGTGPLIVGLQRVNSKLNEWSWNEEAPDCSPLYQHIPQYFSMYPEEFSDIGDGTEGIMMAPPNTETTSVETSAGTSGLPSRPASMLPRKTAAIQGTRNAHIVCGLSDSEKVESQGRFRWHRDSVTLIRERICNVGGASPELLTNDGFIRTAKSGRQGMQPGLQATVTEIRKAESNNTETRVDCGR